jgi:hypothetical protein
MQGIPLTEFKKLLASLSNLKQIHTADLSKDQFENVIEKEKRLKEIYANYQLSLQQVSENIRQFEHHKNTVRKLMKENRHFLKDKKKVSVSASPG